MPELPEVETMVRGLRPALLGARLRAIEVLDVRVLENCSAKELQARTVGHVFTAADRRGKWVVLALEARGGIIVIQPRMTGSFWLVPPSKPERTCLRFHLEGPRDTVWFCDTRRLGRVCWFGDKAAAEAAFARSQGPDALEITAVDLAARLKATTRPIKPALMDQKVLAGIGNIYADEALYRAGLHPSRRSDRLRADEVRRLHAVIRPLLEEAIAAEGSSFDEGYRTVAGLEGGFLAQNAVHRRAGMPCPGCGGLIVKTRIEGLIGRPTYLCPTCQPPRPRR